MARPVADGRLVSQVTGVMGMAQGAVKRELGEGAFTEFDERVRSNGTAGLYSSPKVTTIQVNIGLKCNLICHHCHVNSSPRRKEEMNWETMESILRLAESPDIKTVDITGGAPEMNPNFKRFVSALRKAGVEVMVRTNLTILLEPGYEDFPEFFRDNDVQLVASLPCYLEENVTKQRGEGVYHESITVIRRLNELGYGVRPELGLNLVYNPGGPSLPPDQAELETDYRRELGDHYGILFTNLHTITNVPIGRFRGDLRRQKRLEDYMDLLRQSFNVGTVDALMCRHLISVRWDGTLYDCDFNLALHLPASYIDKPHIDSVSLEDLENRRIQTGDHCFACTAGAGSSCGGALV